MNYISGIFTRADIQQIRKVLLHDVPEMHIDPRSYPERIESGHKHLTTQLHRDDPNEKNLGEITEPIDCHAGAIEEVYREIGLQVGIILATQIEQKLKTAFTGNMIMRCFIKRDKHIIRFL